MNRNASDDGSDDLLLDWGLNERLGAESPPDLVDAVRARLAGSTAGADGSVAGFARMTRRARFAAAAAVMIGTGVVLGVALWPADRATPVRAPQGPQEPLAAVDAVEDVAALASSTRAVEVRGGDDHVIEALRRLCHLEVLVVREPWNESFGLGLKTAAPLRACQVTNASWQHFAALTKLRQLHLSGTALACRLDTGSGENVVAALEALPLLETLSLRFLDAPDAALARLPQLRNLRHLDLSFNHGFTEAGVDAIVQCRSLRTLSLRGCQQLHGAWMAKLRQLPELEELDLSSIDGIDWRAGETLPGDAEGALLLTQARGWADSLGTGVQDVTLAELAKAPRLRVLEIGGGRWTHEGLRALGASATLQELGMSGGHGADPGFVADLPRSLQRLEVCGDYTDAFCAAVRASLPELRHLCVAACYEITDRGLADLLAMPSLRVLDMRQMRGLTVASVDALAKARQLEEIDLRHDDFVTAQHVLWLRRMLPDLRKLETSIAADELVAAEPLPEPVQVRTKADVEALPAGTRNVLATDIEDDCMPALARLRGLEQLEIVAEWASPGMRKVLPAVRSVTDAGLRNLDGLPRLRILRLGGELEVEGPGLEVLAHLPALEELSLELMKVDDAGLANLARAARLQRLRLSYAQGFGRPTTDVVARLTSLRELSLTGCVHMDEQWLAQLAAMRQLESLDLSMIGSHSLSSGLSVPLPPAEPGSGVTDGVLAALAGATNLRTLLLGQAGITGSGLRHLQGLPGLGSLDLGGTPVTGADLRWLPPGIEVLSLHGCRDLGQEFGPVLAAATPRLRSLDLLGCANVGIAGLHALQAVRSLRVLDVSYWPEFGVDSAATEAKSAVAAVTALTGLEGLTLRGWMPIGEQERSALRAMPNLKRLDTDQGTETLR